MVGKLKKYENTLVLFMARQIIVAEHLETNTVAVDFNGDVHFFVWNPKKEEFVANAVIQIGGIEAISDDNGFVKMFVPLQLQNTKYEVKTSVELENNIKTMPSGKYDVMLVK